MVQVPYLDLLYDALHSSLGVVVESDDPERLRMILYSEMRKHGIVGLTLAYTPVYPDELWIVKNGKEEPGEPNKALDQAF